MDNPAASNEFTFGRIRVQFAERRLIIDGGAAKVGARAFDVLLALIERRDRVVSKNELLDLEELEEEDLERIRQTYREMARKARARPRV